MTEPSALAKLLLGEFPKSEAEHYEALGRFITGFAVAEAAVHILARKLSNLPDEKARVLFNSMRLGDVTDRVRAMMRHDKMDDRTQAEVDTCLKQLGFISAKRHSLVHRTTLYIGGALMVSNALISKSATAAEIDRFDERLLSDMAADCGRIYLRLYRLSTNNPVPDGDPLKRPWSYKHVQPKPPSRKSRGTPESPQPPPDASQAR